MQFFPSILLVFGCLCPAFAMVGDVQIKTLPLQHSFHTASNWYVNILTEQKKNNTPVRVCFEILERAAQQCEDMRYHEYTFQRMKALSVVKFPRLVMVNTEFSEDGSGTLNQLAFWRYDRRYDRFISAGHMVFSEQGEYQQFNQTLVLADAIIGKNETHFSPHRFKISMFDYDGQTYVKRHTYITKIIYPSLDDTDHIDVIRHEKKAGNL